MQANEERRDALQAEINQLCRESLQRAKQFLKDMDNKWYEVHWGEAHLKRTERVVAEHNAWEQDYDARMAALEEELERVGYRKDFLQSKKNELDWKNCHQGFVWIAFV